MRQFGLIASGLDMGPVISEIEDNDALFGEYRQRVDAVGSPHSQITDIWVRYADIAEMVATNDFSGIANEHDSVWLKELPEVKKICFKVMSLVDGERLGGVLITKLKPSGEIFPHSDQGWHSSYYDKFYVPIKNEDNSVFYFEDGEIDPNIGDVWQFDNSRQHWVKNNSTEDRIAMIICIKQNKYTRGGGLCLGEQQ